MLKLYNALKRKKQDFKPLDRKEVKIYACGPTVYWYAHIGNLRTYVFEDILKRVLEYNGYKVKHVMNITDVGHLTSDADTGEDKMEEGAKRDKKNVWEIAKFYAKAFKKDLKLLNISPPDIWIKATETIRDQIEFIKILEKKNFVYKIPDGIYFDTSKSKTYGRLWGEKKRKIKPGARVEMTAGKRSPTDFALWKFTPPGVKRQMEWDSPWSRGFPGWHTECVVMGVKKLGIPFDIHCGGIDHIFIHHTNEIAQAEAAYEEILARYWLHGEFLILKKGRMGKSKGNIIILDNLVKKGINPLVYRYLCLTCHYRSKLIFSWQSLKAAENSLNIIYQKVEELKESYQKNKELSLARKDYKRTKDYQKQFREFINNDLDMPKALALTWSLLKDKQISSKIKYELLLDFDRVLGLDLNKIKRIKIPQQVKELVVKREKYRQQKKWKEADEIRMKIKQAGYLVEDTRQGQRIRKLRTTVA